MPQAVIRRAHRPSMALAAVVQFDDDFMHVSLTDGRIISGPILWFPVLHEASADQRNQYEISGGGVRIHWPEIDEDISVAGLLDGADWRST